MLRRVVIAPRQYLEHSISILSCNPLTRHPPPVQLRWGMAAAMSHRYSSVQYASRQEETHVERSLDSGQSSPCNISPSSTCTQSDSSEHLANAFTNFLEHHGRTTRLALQCLNSGLPTFSPIHKILQQPRNIRRVANFLAASAKPTSCIRLLSLSVAYGRHLPNAPIYEGVCWTLWQRKQYVILLEVCRLAKDSLGSLSGRLLDWRLRALCQLANFVSVGAILRDYEDSRVKLSRRSWHLILVAHLRNHNFVGARQSLRMMEQAGFPPDPTTHAVIATNYRHLGLDAQVRDLALSTLDSLPPSNRTFVINKLLETHLHLGDELDFHQLLSLFDTAAINSLRTLLNPSDNGDNSMMPLQALASPVTVTPDVHTFLTAIRFCVARSDPLTADKIFSLMGQRGFDLSPTILAVFFEVQFALDRPGFAVFIASRLLTPGDFGPLYDQLQDCVPEPHWMFPFTASRIHPTVDILNVLMRGLLPAQGLHAARSILELMKRVDVEPNSYTMKILIHYLIHFEQATASYVLRILRQLSPLFRPSLHHLHPIMGRLLRDEKNRLYGSKHTVARFQTFQTHHDLDEFERDLTISGAGLALEQSLGRPNLGRSLLQSLESRGIQSDSAMLGLRMRYEGIIRRDTSTAVDVYNDMLARGITPSVYHVAALMQAFAQQGETDKSLKIMRSVKMKPNLVMYTILLQGYAYQGQPKAAAQIFQTMVADGIQPDVRAIFALCRAFVLARQLSSAKRFLVMLWAFVEPFPRKYTTLPLSRLLVILRSLDGRAPASKRKMGSARRTQLREDLAQVVMDYRRAKGLLAWGSSSVRRFTKSIYVNRKA